MPDLIVQKTVGIGEILWDLLPQGRQMGGAPANFAYHCNTLGCKSYALSAVGNDQLGEEITDEISELQIDHAFIQIDDQFPTGTVEVKIDNDGTPDYVIHNDTAWDNIKFSESFGVLAAQTDALCFGSLAQRSKNSRDTINQFVKATGNDCIRIFDINLRQHFYSAEIIENSLHMAGYFKLNDEEFTVISEMFSFSGSEEKIVSQIINKFDLELIALTKGARGSDLFTKNDHSFMQSSAIKVEDTVGAGDAFTAALAVSSLQKKPLTDIHHNAVTLATYVCSQKGATPVLTQEIRSQLK